jgi:hypothetical protein
MGGVNNTHALHQLVPLAAELNQNKVTPGLLGFVIFAVIALGLWALMKNMGKQMRKIDFEEQPDDAGSPVARTADEPRTSEAPRAAAAARAPEAEPGA